MSADSVVLFVDATAARAAPSACEEMTAMLALHLTHAETRWLVVGKDLEGAPAQAALLVVRGACAALLSLLDPLRKRFSRVPVLGLLTDRVEQPGPITELLAQGLDDFLMAPVRACELVPRVQRLLAGVPPAGFPHAKFSFILGRSRALQDAVDRVPRIALCDAACLITGETGTGKELFARAIHYSSKRASGPFIPVNCGALPDSLFENELFGHVRGAYTGAATTACGLLEVADKGTLFLDEVDTLSSAAQVKLLRFLQEGEYRPLGSTQVRRADVRVLSATNTDLRRRVAAGLFREDLFHRLNVLYVAIPSLRDRAEDIGELAHALVKRFSESTHPRGLRLGPSALRKLMRYQWPGNVRELESVVQRAVVLAAAECAELKAEDIDVPDSAHAGAAHELAPSLREAKTAAIDNFERHYLIRLLAEHSGNISRAARAAGKERRAFQRLLDKHRIERASLQAARPAEEDSGPYSTAIRH